jgi:apolipoprotein N-acyltransferase
MAVIRAVEFRRWLVRSANTGVSFVVDPAGRVVKKLGLFEEGILYADVEPRDDVTVYARHGDFIVAILGAVMVVIGLFARAPRVGHDDEPEEDDASGSPLIRST